MSKLGGNNQNLDSLLSMQDISQIKQKYFIKSKYLTLKSSQDSFIYDFMGNAVTCRKTYATDYELLGRKRPSFSSAAKIIFS